MGPLALPGGLSMALSSSGTLEGSDGDELDEDVESEVKVVVVDVENGSAT